MGRYKLYDCIKDKSVKRKGWIKETKEVLKLYQMKRRDINKVLSAFKRQRLYVIDYQNIEISVDTGKRLNIAWLNITDHSVDIYTPELVYSIMKYDLKRKVR